MNMLESETNMKNHKTVIYIEIFLYKISGVTNDPLGHMSRRNGLVA